MEIFGKEPRFTFDSKEEADGFLKKLREDSLKYDVITMNDILARRLIRTEIEGYHYGYHKDEIKKMKVVKENGEWCITMPIPSKMVRDENGYWTTINVLTPVKDENGG